MSETAVDKPIMTADELADLLRIKRKTVYALIAQGDIPGARRVGGSIRIHRQTVLDWLAQGDTRRRRHGSTTAKVA